MRNTVWMSVVISLLLLFPAVGSLRAADHEQATVAAASEVARALTAVPLKCIPPTLMHQAKGVAIIPHVVKAGFLVDRRFGRGVILARRPDGSWSDPVFITLSGGGLGVEAGFESTDLVLVFKTEGSLDHILKGKGTLTLGADVTVAAGPIGREAEAATDRLLKAEVFSYSRSRGLFAGLSLEGDTACRSRCRCQRSVLPSARRPSGRRDGSARRADRSGGATQGASENHWKHHRSRHNTSSLHP